MTEAGHVHVVGGGLAGLSAALRLSGRGRRVTVYEAAPQAGGRCRSYLDSELGCRIDNGNHLLLSGNRAAFAFLREVGAEDTLAGPSRPLFPFYDGRSGERWTLRPNAGRLPWWLFVPGRRVPGARLRDFAGLARLHRAPPDATVADAMPHGELYRRLVEPLAIAGLNTMPETGSARLLGAIVRETLAAGGRACIPAFPREGLSESFVDPACRTLHGRGGEVVTGRRLTALRREGGRVRGLRFADGEVGVGPDDDVVMAVPAPVAATLLPGLSVPTEHEAILNLHYRLDLPPTEAGFVGMIGTLAEWVFVKPGVVSVTVSAANRHAGLDNSDAAATVWQEIALALRLRGSATGDAASIPPMPPHRVVREKRATFAATPAQEGLRPGPRGPDANLALAGDWTRTGLPSTIEGAIRSGLAAAALIEDRP